MAYSFDLVTVLNSFSALFGQLVVLIKLVLWMSRRENLRNDLRQVMARLCRSFPALRQQELEASAEELMRQKRLEVSRFFLNAGVVLGALRGFEATIRALSGEWLSSGGSWRAGFGMMLFLWTIILIFPRIATALSLPFLYMANMLILSISVSPLFDNTIGDLLANRTQLLMFGIFVSMIWPSFRFVVVGNAIFTVCYCSGYAMVWTEESGLATPLDIGRLEFLIWFWQSAMFWIMEKVIQFGVQKEVEERIGKCHLTGVMSLLSLMCDAVVDLDDDLALKEHSPKLAGLLMHGTGKSLEGALLADFIIDRDQPIISDFAKVSAGDGTTMGGSGMHVVSVRDSMGNCVKTILYHVPYFSGSGQMNHLIGLREDDGPGESRVGDLASTNFRQGPANVTPNVTWRLRPTPETSQDEDEEDEEGEDSSSERTPRSPLPVTPPPQPLVASLGARVPAALLRPDLQMRLARIHEGSSVAVGSHSLGGASSQASETASQMARSRSRGAEGHGHVVDVIMNNSLTFSHVSSDLVARFGAQEGTPLQELLADPEDSFVGWLRGKNADVLSGQERPGIFNYGYVEIAKLPEQLGEPRGPDVAPVGFSCKVFFPAPDQDCQPYRVSIKLRGAAGADVGRRRSGAGTRARSEPQALRSQSDSSQNIVCM